MNFSKFYKLGLKKQDYVKSWKDYNILIKYVRKLNNERLKLELAKAVA